MPTVLITDFVDDLLKKRLCDASFTIKEIRNSTKAELIEAIQDVDAIIVRSRTKLTEDIINAAKKLKVIARFGVSLSNIDLFAAENREISVINSPESSTRSVAELVIGYLFLLTRQFHIADKSMKQGQWTKKRFIGWELKGKTLGILGFGRIGKEVARIASGLDMRILAYQVKPSDPDCKLLGVIAAAEKKVLRESDFITVNIPLWPSNIRYIDSKKLNLMKPTAFIINTSRGKIIDEKALLDALNKGQIAGAALDVFSEEPPTSKSLWDLINNPRVISTPHIGAQTHEALRSNSDRMADRLIQIFDEL